ncbi:MAG: DUF460 domain-containing protein [Desulfurococcaceae archaeon]
MGVDIKPGYSPRSSREPRYAVVILRDDEVIRALDDVPLHIIVRFILEYHVDILAVDSVQEIARSRRDIVKLSKVIPSWCKLVEVTRTDEGFISVQELVKSLNLGFDVTDPVKTALVNAYAALKGLGKEVPLHSEYTYVVVTKGRTPVQGGASASRFRRSIRASILQLVKEVKSKLDEAKLEYDLVVKKSEGGLERGVFIVYAPPEVVRNVVSPVKSRNIRVVVKPAPLRKPTARSSRRPLIVGIDPGTTIGVAALDLDGRPVLITSLRSPDREKLIELLLSKGKPVLLAVDTAKPPEYVKKISAMTNTQIYAPDRDLSTDEKQRMISEYISVFNIVVPDVHAGDALAAALKAYKLMRPLIEEVESKIRDIAGVERDVVVVEVLKGKPLTHVLEEIFARILASKRTREVVYEEIREKPCPDVEKLQAKQRELEALIRRLEEEIKSKDEVIRSLELELKMASKKALSEECERRVNQLRSMVDHLRKVLEEKLKAMEVLSERNRKLEELILELASGKLIVAIKNPRNTCPEYPVYVDDPRNISLYVECAKSRKTAILVPMGSKIDWMNLRVPVVEVSVVYDSGSYVIVDSKVLREAHDMWRVIEEVEARERRERILKMIKEYQESRRLGTQ